MEYEFRNLGETESKWAGRMVAMVPRVEVKGNKKDDLWLELEGESCKFFRIIHRGQLAGYRWEIRRKGGHTVLEDGGHGKRYEDCVIEGFTKLLSRNVRKAVDG